MYQKGKANDMPKKRRNRKYRFASAKEWALMRADIDRGVKPGQALQIALTESDMQKYGIKNRKTVWRFVKKYILDNGLDYVVESFPQDGVEYIQVKRDEVRETRTA